MDKKQEYDEKIAKLADEIHNLLIKNSFDRDYCIRYNEKLGAYVSIGDDYCDDIIILRPDRKHAALTYNQLKNTFRDQLSSQPVYAMSNAEARDIARTIERENGI